MMSEFFRKYWFVCLIAVALVAGLGYYIADMNKDNVSSKKTNGQDVVASTSLGDVTSDEIFDKYQNFNQSLLYNMYQTAVVDQSVKADSSMESAAKTMARNVKANMDADTSGKTRYQVLSELASYGFEGEDSLKDYCLFTLKAASLEKDYILNHYDELNELTVSPRTVSVITLEVPNAEVLTDEKQAKKDSIDKALENGDSFAQTATAFSEDTATADKEGYFGYIDSNSTSLPSEVVEAAVDLDKGSYSEWITTENSQTGMSVLYLVYVNETDPKAILESENDTDMEGLTAAYMTADTSLQGKIVAQAAENLDITFDNDEVKSKIDAAIAQATGTDAQSSDSENTEEKTSEDDSHNAADEADQNSEQTGGSDETDK